MKTAQEWFEEGKALFEKAKHLDAIECCNQAISLDPKYMEAYRIKARALSGLGKFQEVLECCDEAIAIDPSYKFVYNNKGNAYLRLREYQKALDTYDKAISLDSKWHDPLNGKGHVLRILNRTTEAIEYYDKAIAIQPNISSYGGKAVLFLLMGKNEEALEAYTQGNLIAPSPFHRCAKGALLQTMGRSREALAELKEAQRLIKEGHLDLDVTPANMILIRATLDLIEELELMDVQVEATLKQADQNNPKVQEFIAKLRNLQKEKEEATAALITGITKGTSIEEKLKQDIESLRQQFSDLQKDMTQVKNEIQKVRNQLEEVKEELNNKLDDWNRKLETELAKLNLPSQDQTKLKDYFRAFVETFSSAYVTAQVIDSGQLQLNSSNSKIAFLSMIASFTPFIGGILSTGVKTLGEFLESKE